MSQRYLDVHVLQSVPPSNLNRDDAGSPKQAIYGGVTRARVSSQAWKRATRVAFADHLAKEDLGTRTKRLHALIAGRLANRAGLDTDAAGRLTRVLLETGLAIKAGKKETELSYLLFLGYQQVEAIVDLLAGDAAVLVEMSDAELSQRLKDIGKQVAPALQSGHPIDVALFGRMVADLSNLNVDAAAQVAHALSTHAVQTEFDYFTAVDDENKESAGAAMIGSVEFTSATLYRFATVGVDQLTKNLDGDIGAARAALRLFVSCLVRSMPTGHITSFAHRTVPELVALVVRDDQPVNLVSAFETPVRSSRDGHARESARLLAVELGDATTMWGLTPQSVHATYSAALGELTSMGAPVAFDDAVDGAVASAFDAAPVAAGATA